MVVGFGESSVDHVYVLPELPRAGTSKLRISSSFTACGGQVATTMAACAAFGMSAAYLGPIGHDEDGRSILAELNARGVDTSRALVRPATTRYAVILVDEKRGDRIVLAERDAALDVPPHDLTSERIRDARVVHVDGVDEPAALQLARLARGAGAIVTCDVDTVTSRTTELLDAVTHPILAADVPRRLTGIDDLEGSLRALRKDHPGLLCVTLGERGAAALDGERFLHVPALAVRAIDTTSAGDVFRAGFIYALVERWPVDRLLRFANAAAAAACTRPGALTSIPSLEDVLRRAYG